MTALTLLLWLVGISEAKERTEWVDENEDGRKETQLFYKDKQIVKALVDRNGDGNVDNTVLYKKGVRHTSELDRDFDGKVDTWTQYDDKGMTLRTAKDTNMDGKADYFKQMVRGRDLIIKEYDRNHDGKIDRRIMSEWDPNKKMSIFTNKLESIAMPGYRNVWREEDNDFDGKIDAYWERKKPDAGKDKIGKPIQ